jgi:large subunit ribosomal protein L9
MEIILLERIGGLGNLGDQVKVRPGYARNYLIPAGKAVPATKEQKAAFETRRAALEAAAADTITQARARAAALEGARLEIEVKASEEGTLYGSVNVHDIADAADAAGLELHRSEIHLPAGPLKEVGEHDVTVTLHPEVDVHITVSVVTQV